MVSMLGMTLMADASISKLDSVLAGLRGYLTEQLGELDAELDTARKLVVELGEELAVRQSAVEVLVASRDLLVAKLGELDGVAPRAAVVPQARQSTEDAAPEVEAASVVAKAAKAVKATKSVKAVKAVKAAKPVKAVESAEAAKPVNAARQQVLDYLVATPGVHKVAEIAAAVSGPEATAAALQAVRRALGALTASALVERSEQSGTAFYSATGQAAVAPVEAEATAEVSAPVTRKPRKAVAGKAAPAKQAVTAEKPAKAAKPVEAAKAEKPVAADKPAVRADRTRIVATLLDLREPQSAGDVSRAVMGSEWKSSDATNFRSVLKSLVNEGVVTELVGEHNRTRYTVAASS